MSFQQGPQERVIEFLVGVPVSVSHASGETLSIASRRAVQEFTIETMTDRYEALLGLGQPTVAAAFA